MSMRYPAGFISAFYNPLENPNPPTIGTASPVSPTSLSITFTAPTVIGGSAITGFIATAKRTSDGVLFSATGASSPITITGLTAVAFTVTVVAVNSYGPSASSAESNSVTPAQPAPTVIGQAYEGGFWAGNIGVSSVATHYLVVGPLSTAQSGSLAWKNAGTATPGADSDIDGPQNTADMVADGNSTVYPCAHFCNDLVIGGFSDWYMPAKNELEVCYFNLKPTTNSNDTSSGINPNAVPARASNYTAGTPARTSAVAFQTGGAEPFIAASQYWCSTETSDTNARVQYFKYGNQNTTTKGSTFPVRAVRRVAV
jgi:hypothetical protein